MQISSGSNIRTPFVSSSTGANNAASASSIAPSDAESKKTGLKTADFTSMTRKELFEWMNARITSGEMSLDESTPFLGMTLKVSAATGNPVDLETDTERFNFVAKAREGIEGALYRKDDAEANRLKSALALMQQRQGTAIGINARA